MNFWLHKINPSQNSNNEYYLYNLLTKFHILGTGYSDLDGYSIDAIKNLPDDTLKKIIDDLWGSNVNSVTIYNIKNFVSYMKSGDIVMIPLTKAHDNDVIFVKIIDNNAINSAADAKALIKNEDIGFIRNVEILKECKFDELNENLQNFITSNLRSNTTIKINQDEICDYIVDMILKDNLNLSE